MPDPIEHLREIIDYHREHHRDDGGEVTCDCGAEGLTDHSRHVAEEIVDRLGLSAEHVRGEMR